MTVYETFAGIGGFSLGFQRAGFEIVGGCEIDPYARAVYKKNFGIEPDGDIRAIQSVSADIICGGFPCQDISAANANATGLEGERSGLWRELARIIANSRPRWVVVENVPALLRWQFGDILRFFSEIGYLCEWEVLSARAFGAHHRRERIWIVAYPSSQRGRIQSGRRGGESRKEKAHAADDGAKESVANSETVHRGAIERHEPNGVLSKDVANAKSGGRKQGNQNPGGRKARTGTQEERTRPSYDGGWLPEPNVGRVAHGVPNRVDRLKCLGNSIVPQIAEWIAERIKQVENEKGQKGIASDPAPFGGSQHGNCE